MPELTFDQIETIDGRRVYGFGTSEPVLPGERCYLRPRRDAGFERAVRRRLSNIVAARSNVELLRALDDPARVAIDPVLRDVAAPGVAPPELDASKKDAWASIAAGKSISIVVGPPGVGKTFLISHLVNSILVGTPSARILVSAQSHDTLVLMEDELRKLLLPAARIVVRVERANADTEKGNLRDGAERLLRQAEGAASGMMSDQSRPIRQALDPVDSAEKAISERVFRDTEGLLLRSADVTLASTSSNAIEEMIADGEQFDWVFVEEAARANGSELIGALLLGNRRVMIGDHNQLSPFEAAERLKYYQADRAAELLKDGRKQLASISDLPPEVDVALAQLEADEALLVDALAGAARMEEPFRTIAEREQEREEVGTPTGSISTLLEQSRMHPAICALVSDVFYGGKLVPSDRVKRRPKTVASTDGFPATPIVVLNLPALSTVGRAAFEEPVKKTFRNPVEAAALVSALKHLRPVPCSDGRRPTLAVLSPYAAQVKLLERLVHPLIDSAAATLAGFASPRSGGGFIFTSDSFQGGEADLILASLVRNNVLAGGRALGFVQNSQRMNVLLSRARQKLVLATSLQFFSGGDRRRRSGQHGWQIAVHPRDQACARPAEPRG